MSYEEEARNKGEILDQDIENAYEAYVIYWGKTPTVSDVVERLFNYYPEYEKYWDTDPMDGMKFYNHVKAGLRYLGFEVKEDFEEARLNTKDLQYINSILNKSVQADNAKRLILGYLAQTYSPSEVTGNLGAEAMEIVNTRFKEALVSASDQNAQNTELDPEALRNGKEELIKQKLQNPDLDLSEIDDDTINAMAGEDADSEEVAKEVSVKLGLEDEDALKDLDDKDLDQVVSLLGGEKQEESFKVDKDGNLMQESVNNVLEYYNSRNAADIDLAIALKEHCGLTKDEVREVIKNRYFETEEIQADQTFDKLAEFIERIKEQTKLSEASIHAIHDAFEAYEPEPTAITCGPAAINPVKETDKPKDLNADNPLEEIKGEKIKEGQIAQELSGALRDVRAAKEANLNYDTIVADKALNRAEQSIELAKIDAVRQDV